MAYCAIIQARVNSRRFPGKLLLDLRGKPVLQRIIERVKQSDLINNIVVAASGDVEDLELARICAALNVNFFAGNPDDVLDRYYKAAREFEARNIVRITPNSPLIDATIIDDVITGYELTQSDYCSNALTPSYPLGEKVEVFSFSALEKAWQNAQTGPERECVTAYITKHPDIFKLHSVSYVVDISDKKWALDTQKDYDFIKKIYDAMPDPDNFSLTDVLDMLRKHPYLESATERAKTRGCFCKTKQKDNKR